MFATGLSMWQFNCESAVWFVRLFFMFAMLLSSQGLSVSMPMIIAAAQSNHLSLLRQIAQGGGNVNVTNALGRTAAHYAIAQKKLVALQVLLDNGANPNLADNDGNTLYDLWSEHKDRGKLELLHRAEGKPLDLFQAAYSNDRDSAERLIAAGANAIAKDAEGRVPFDIAAELRHAALAAILLHAAAGVEGKDEKSWTPLHWAVAARDWDLVREYIRQGADISAGRQQSALELATHVKGEAKLIEIVMEEKGVDAVFGLNDDNLLMLAAKVNSVAAAQLLLDNGVDINAINRYWQTAVTLGVEYGNREVVELLVASQADLNIRDRQGRAAAFFALYNRDINMLRLLIDNNADVNLANNVQSTLLTWAAEAGEIDMVELLIDNDAEINARNMHGDTPLMLLAKKHNSDEPKFFHIIALLIAKHADVNLPNYYGETPLMWTALTNQIKTLIFFLQHGADINKQNERGGTALTRAAQFGRSQIVQILIDNGVDPNLKNRRGKTALDIAEEAGHSGVVAILRAEQE